MQMTIKRIIAHGCSFTYGQELDDPSTQAWPALIAKELNVELVNLAQPGYSNDGVVQDLVEFDLKDGDFVTIGWTTNQRLLFVDNEGWYTTMVFEGDTDYRAQVTNLLLKTTSLKWLYTRWLTQVLLMQSYFNDKHIPFLFFNTFENFQGEHKLVDSIDTIRFFGLRDFAFHRFSDQYPRHPGYHPGFEAHKAFSEVLLKEIYALL